MKGAVFGGVASVQLNTTWIPGSILVSRGQTLFFAQGRYRFQYKRPARKGSGRVYYGGREGSPEAA